MHAHINLKMKEREEHTKKILQETEKEWEKEHKLHPAQMKLIMECWCSACLLLPVLFRQFQPTKRIRKVFMIFVLVWISFFSHCFLFVHVVGFFVVFDFDIVSVCIFCVMHDSFCLVSSFCSFVFFFCYSFLFLCSVFFHSVSNLCA